jgi:hypothetical protein
MRNFIILLGILIGFVTNVNAQLKKDGTPDMRYKANKQVYGNSSYSTPSNTYNYNNTNTTYQSGYYRSNGTYVKGHYKTKSNSTNHDNYSTKGNYNPYTGSNGSRAKDYSTGAYNYGKGKTIHTGSRGGQYYINSNGNKTYVPKRN